MILLRLHNIRNTILQIQFYQTMECSCCGCYIADIDDCLNEPCKNGGSCFDKVNGFRCTCVAGYTGDTCESGKLLC